MAQALIFHYREADTFLHKINPLIKLITLFLLCTSLVTTSFYKTLIILSLAIFSMIAVKLPIIKFKKELSFFIIISAVIGISSYFSNKTIIDLLNSILKFDTAVLLSFILADTTDPSDIARSLAKSLNHIPFINAWAFASQVELTLMCIPLIFDVSQSISEARESRLENIKKHPLKFIINYSVSLIDNLLYKIDEIAFALDSRGYGANIERESKKYSIIDFIFLIFIVFVIGGLYYVK